MILRIVGGHPEVGGPPYRAAYCEVNWGNGRRCTRCGNETWRIQPSHSCMIGQLAYPFATFRSIASSPPHNALQNKKILEESVAATACSDVQEQSSPIFGLRRTGEWRPQIGERKCVLLDGCMTWPVMGVQDCAALPACPSA